MNAKAITVYQCNNCLKTYHHEKYATECCVPNKCEICGTSVSQYRSKCDACVSKERYEKAVKISAKNYDGYVYDDNKEEYFYDIDALIEYYTDNELELPTNIHPCLTNEFEINIDHALDCEMENHHEDAEYSDLVDLDELYNFVKQWNAKQSISSLEPNTSVIITLEGYDEEIKASD